MGGEVQEARAVRGLDGLLGRLGAEEHAAVREEAGDGARLFCGAVERAGGRS